MSQEIHEKVYQLISEANALGHTPEAVALAEEAVRLADAHNDAPLGYEARQRLMDVAVYSGEHDKVLVAFSWCLAHADKVPSEYYEWELLWKYKWVLEHLVHFPRVTREQIYATLEDFQSRCRKGGYNERPALFLRWNAEMQLGNLTEARQWWQKWQLTERDSMADCEACEINRVAELHAACDEHEAAILAAEPILSGRKKCGEIPHLTYATLLRSYWLTRGPEETAQIHEKGYRLVRSNRDFIREQSWHVLHLVRANEMDRAMALVRRHLVWALETHNLDNQFYFLIATRAVLQRLEGQGSKSARLRLPEKLYPQAGKTTVVIRPFLAWLNEKIESLVSDFDRRNGNQWFRRMADNIHTVP